MNEIFSSFLLAILMLIVGIGVLIGAFLYTNALVEHDCTNYGKYEYKVGHWIKCEVQS